MICISVIIKELVHYVQMPQINSFTKTMLLHHYGKVPLAAYQILSGEMYCRDAAGNQRVLRQGDIIGPHELWNHLPLLVDIEVKENSQVIFYNKSFIKEILFSLQHPFEIQTRSEKK